MSEPVVPPQVTPPAAPPATPPETPPTPPATPQTPPAAAVTPQPPPATTTPPPEEPTEPPVGTIDPETGEYVIPDDLDALDSRQLKEVIDKSVKAGVSKATSGIVIQRINTEVKEIIDAHPEYKPFADRIKKWVTHPNRIKFIKNGFPVQSVVLEAIAPHLEKIGAEKARIADKKARESAGNGVTTPPTVATTTPDYKSMSNTDITDLAEKVKSGRA